MKKKVEVIVSSQLTDNMIDVIFVGYADNEQSAYEMAKEKANQIEYQYSVYSNYTYVYGMNKVYKNTEGEIELC